MNRGGVYEFRAYLLKPGGLAPTMAGREAAIKPAEAYTQYLVINMYALDGAHGKGGRRDALAINPKAAARIRAYLEKAGHGEVQDGPMFRPLRGSSKAHDPAGQL